MSADSIRTLPVFRDALPAEAPPLRDAAYEARPRLIQLREALRTAAVKPHARRKPWGEPAVFFFDRSRQAELEAARPRPTKRAAHPLEELVAREVAALCESVEVRRMARAIPGLREALFPGRLADLLAVPDDETVLVLHPALRLGYRLHVRGVADVNQFQVLMLAALTAEIEDNVLPAAVLPARFAAACGAADPAIPAGVPMAVELPFQFLRPSAVRPDGTAPESFRGCAHWLWGWEPLAAAPRIDGERVIVLAEPAYRAVWDVDRRFPAMAAAVELLQVLSPFQVAERLGRLAGRPVPVRVRAAHGELFAEAA